MTNILRNDLPYRKCVGIMLLNRDNLVWVGKRIPKWEGDALEHWWQMPQGGIDDGESPEQAAFRELEEETGANKAHILDCTKGWLLYDLPDEALGIALKGKFRGQKQKWFAMRYDGEDSDIDIAPEGGERPEFSEWQWIEMDRLPELVVPFKQEVYVRVCEAFRHLRHS